MVSTLQKCDYMFSLDNEMGSFLDIDHTIHNNYVTNNIYDKRDDLDFWHPWFPWYDFFLSLRWLDVQDLENCFVDKIAI